MIVQQPTVEFEINISDRSFVTNATYQTDAQSNFSVKIRKSLTVLVLTALKRVVSVCGSLNMFQESDNPVSELQH